MESDFEEITTKIINDIANTNYKDLKKEILKIEILRNIARFLQSEEIYRENIEILNERASNGKKRSR